MKNSTVSSFLALTFVVLLAPFSSADPNPTRQEISDVVRWTNGKAYFFYKSGQYIRFDVAANKADDGFPNHIAGNWLGLWENNIDAAVLWNNGKAYFFKGSEYVSYDITHDQVDKGYPAPISKFWKRLWTKDIDAAVRWNDGKAYFFKGEQVVVYDVSADHGERKMKITERFPGVWPSGIDAVELWDNGKAYFFKGDRYIQFDVAKNHADEGYPKSTVGNWQGLSDNQAAYFGWKAVAETALSFGSFFKKDFTLMTRFMPQYPYAYTGPILAENRGGGFFIGQADFDSKLPIDAAMTLPTGMFSAFSPPNKAFFFKGDQVVRYDIAGKTVDDNYPKAITEEFPGIWDRDIDAAVPWGAGKIYFFKGDKYILYNALQKKVEATRVIKDFWHGLWPRDIDAAIPWDNGKIYFFKGSEYMRYDVKSDTVEATIPIKNEWKGVFESDIDAAAWWPGGGAYFFKGTDYIPYEVKRDQANSPPKPIADNFPGVLGNTHPMLVMKIGKQARYYAVGGMKPGVWSHIALVRSGNTFTLRFNGEELRPPVVVTPTDSTLPPDSNTLQFGRRNDENQAQFYGLIDDVAVFKKALSAEEIKDILTRPTGRLNRAEPDLIAGWTFDDDRDQPDIIKRSVKFRSLVPNLQPSGVTLISSVRNNTVDRGVLPLAFQRTQRKLPFKPGQAWFVIQGMDNPGSSHHGYAAFSLDLGLAGEESKNKPKNPKDDGRACGEPIFVTAPGVIQTAWNDMGGGGPDVNDFDEPNFVYVVHKRGEIDSYFHLFSGLITGTFAGKKLPISVERGQKMGVVGTLNGCHLHVGVFEKAENPSDVDFPQEFTNYEVSEDQGSKWRRLDRGTPEVGQWIRNPL